MEVGKATEFSLEQETQLRESLKRCSPETVEAAIAYRKNGEIEGLPTVVLGIIVRFIEPEYRYKLKEDNDDLRVVEGLGVDSLIMVEIVMLVEEALDLSIQNDELMEVRTVGDIKGLINCKVRGIPMPEKSNRLRVEEIAAIVPYQHPFLFLREATLEEGEARGLYPIQEGEVFLEGHFKDNPIFPASLMIEALGQLAVLFLLTTKRPEFTGKVDATKIMFASCDGVRCHRPCKPGDVLNLSVKLARVRFPLAIFEGAITVGEEKVAFAEEIALIFGYQ